MNNQAIQETLRMAKHFQESAFDELARPEEDVVHYMVCQSAHHSALQYLKAYLLTKEVELIEHPSLNELIRHCKLIDPKFDKLQIKAIYDTSHPEEIWEDRNMSNDFMQLLNDTISLIDS